MDELSGTPSADILDVSQVKKGIHDTFLRGTRRGLAMIGRRSLFDRHSEDSAFRGVSRCNNATRYLLLAVINYETHRSPCSREMVRNPVHSSSASPVAWHSVDRRSLLFHSLSTSIFSSESVMASNPDAPLAPFARLGPSVFLQDPADTGDESDRPVIFLAFWMNAPPRALAKYVVEYRRMVPSARIIFIRSSSNDFFLHSSAKAQRERVGPAVQALRASATPENPVLMHLFSNGGLSSTTHLLQAYRDATGTPLPISSMIVDSAPGTASMKGAIRAFSFALPQMWILRLIGKSFLWLSLILVKMVHAITRSPDPISRARKVINDTTLVRAVNAKNIPTRCYIYSDADDLVDWRDVESHASESAASGWVVRRERFQGSPHVGHMRAAPDRYWGIVREYLDASLSA